MSLQDELILLIVGACIGWVSSIGTTILTTLLNQWLAERNSLAQKKEKLYYLTGKLAALPHDRPSDIIKDWVTEKETLNHIIRKSNKADLDGLIGSVESFLEKATNEGYSTRLPADNPQSIIGENQ